MTSTTAEIQVRRGAAAAWTAANPVLADGEWGKESDTGKVKLGDGTTPWMAQPYVFPVDTSALATTTALASETSRAQAAEAQLAPLITGWLPVTGGTSSAATVGQDHTTAIQAYINGQAAANPLAQVTIDCPPRYYRVQNLLLPGNVKLRCYGTVFQYVDASLGPPTGPGNYVITCAGSYNQIDDAVVLGSGAAQPGVGGVWLKPANVNGGGNQRAYKTVLRGLRVNNLGHRGIFDQGVNTQIDGHSSLVENVLMGQAGAPYFLGAVELAGTDAMVSHGEFTPSVTVGNGNVLGSIPVPRAPTQFLQASVTTTNGSISLPLSNATITLTSTAFAAATGGAILIGGTLISYAGVSGSTLTGSTSGGSGTITTGTSVFAPIGFCAALVIGGASHYIDTTDAEIGDVSVACVPCMLATCQQTVTITTTPQNVLVDTTAHVNPSGGSLLVVNNTASNWAPTTLLYTGTSGGNTLTGVSVASSTVNLTTGQAILSAQLPSQIHTSKLRGDLSMTHGWIVGPGSGQMQGAEALRCAVTADNIYYGFYAPAGAGSNWDFEMPRADSTSVTNRFQYAIVDQNTSGSNYNRWTFPRPLNCRNGYFTGNTAGGWFTIADSPGVQLATGATPNVSDNTAFVDANGSAMTITNFTGGVNGQEITFLQGVNTSIANNANIVTKSGATIAPPGAGYAALRFKKMGYGVAPTPAWFQV